MSLHWTENRANVLKRNQTKTSSSICQLALLLAGELVCLSYISRISRIVIVLISLRSAGKISVNMQIITLLLFCLGAKAFVQIPAPYNNFGWFIDNNNAYAGFYPGGVSPHSMATPFLAYPNAYPYLNYPYTLPYYTYRYGNQQDVPFVPNVVKTVETSGKPQPSPPKVEQPKLADADEPFSPPSPSRLGKFKTAAVSSDGIPCSQIGRDVLVDGGNAVDAAIATVFCIGAVNPQSAGIGGGFHMTIYDPVGPVAQSLDAREVAPIAATEDMFKGNASISQRGGLAVAVPGELAGSWAAHQKYGKLPWSRLVLPTAEMAEKGIPVNSHLANSLKEFEKLILDEPSMRIFVNEETGKVKQLGDIVKNPPFAQTLRTIANEGVGVFYNGILGDKVVEDIQKKGGIITKEDLMQYRPEWKEPIKVELNNNFTLYSMPPPGSGILTAFILNILDGHLEGETNGKASRDPTNYHRIAEAFKHAYAHRTKLADPNFVPEVNKFTRTLMADPEALAAETYAKINDSFTYNDPGFYGAVTYNQEDHGTAHMSVLDGNGMAVSVTSTVNLKFGAGWISEQTGILMNDEMDDFSSPNVINYFGVPPSPANFIRPGKRPMSSMTPTIIVNSRTGRVRSVIGAAGGTKITTSTAYAIIRNLWFGETIKEAIDSPRMHHQLFPMKFQYEKGFPSDIVNNMTTRGHSVTEFPGNGAVVCGITVEADGFIYANSDWRKSGDVQGIDPVDL